MANSAWQPLAQAGAHGLFQGGLAAAQGGSFLQGAAIGAASSGIASFTTGGGPLAQMAMSAFTGGAIAEITGGNFVEGFATGLTVSALNHGLHDVAEKVASRQMIKKIESVVEMMREKNLELGLYSDGDYRNLDLTQIEEIDFNFKEYPRDNSFGSYTTTPYHLKGTFTLCNGKEVSFFVDFLAREINYVNKIIFQGTKESYSNLKVKNMVEFKGSGVVLRMSIPNQTQYRDLYRYVWGLD